MHAQPPAPAAQPITGRGHNHQIGGTRPDIGRGAPITLHQHHAGEKQIQQPFQVRIKGADPPSERPLPGDAGAHSHRGGGRLPAGPTDSLQRDHCRAGIVGLEAVEHAAGGGRVPHDHGTDGVADGGREGGLQALVDLDEVTEQTKGAAGRGQHVIGDRTRRLGEGHRQRLASRRPVPQIALGRGAALDGGLQRGRGDLGAIGLVVLHAKLGDLRLAAAQLEATLLGPAGQLCRAVLRVL